MLIFSDAMVFTAIHWKSAGAGADGGLTKGMKRCRVQESETSREEDQVHQSCCLILVVPRFLVVLVSSLVEWEDKMVRRT